MDKALAGWRAVGGVEEGGAEEKREGDNGSQGHGKGGDSWKVGDSGCHLTSDRPTEIVQCRLESSVQLRDNSASVGGLWAQSVLTQ